MRYPSGGMKLVVASLAVLLLGATAATAGTLPVVTGAAFSPATGRTTLTWQDADGGVTYNIYRASTPINASNLISARRIASRVASGVRTFSFQVIDSGNKYYAILPVSPAGGELKTFTVNAAGPVAETDTTPPAAVEVAGTFVGTGLKLTWGPVEAANAQDIVKWRVRRKIGTSGTPTQVGEFLTSYDPTGETTNVAIPTGTTVFYYSVTAVDSSGNASAQGNWVMAANRPDLTISAATSIAANKDIVIAKAFPKKSQAVQMKATVRNAGPSASAACNMTIADGLGFATQAAIPAIAAGASAEVAFQYTPSTAGLASLALTLDSGSAVAELSETNNSATVQVPVVTNDTYVMWYGDVTDLKYVNVPMTRTYSINEWKRRGAYAASFAGAAGSNLAQSYRTLLEQGFDSLAIDEIGAPTDIEVIIGIEEIKSEYPQCFIAAWHVGSVIDAEVVRLVQEGKINLLVFEVYITPPDGTWQQTLQNYINSARAAGIANRCIIGLGSNATYSGGYTASQHAAFIEQQIAYIRANAAEMPGIAFFDAYTLPGERAMIDEICRQQFVK